MRRVNNRNQITTKFHTWELVRHKIKKIKNFKLFGVRRCPPFRSLYFAQNIVVWFQLFISLKILSYRDFRPKNFEDWFHLFNCCKILSLSDSLAPGNLKLRFIYLFASEFYVFNDVHRTRFYTFQKFFFV